MVSIIAAMAEDSRAIGLRGGLPWRLPADMARFRRLTMGHAVIMGRVTWEPIAGRGLPGRRVIVLTRGDRERVLGARGTRSADEAASGVGAEDAACKTQVPEWPAVHIARSLEAALQLAEPDPETFIAGGASVYEQALAAQLVDRMVLTLIQAEFEADTFFPAFDAEDWNLVADEHRPADDQNRFAMRFQTLERRERN